MLAEQWHYGPIGASTWRLDDDGLTIPRPRMNRENITALYWHLLGYEHDDMKAEAETIRKLCIRAVHRYRATQDPIIGRDQVDRRIASFIQAAAVEFTEDLRRERQWRGFRSGLCEQPLPLAGRPFDWRERRAPPG